MLIGCYLCGIKVTYIIGYHKDIIFGKKYWVSVSLSSPAFCFMMFLSNLDVKGELMPQILKIHGLGYIDQKNQTFPLK